MKGEVLTVAVTLPARNLFERSGVAVISEQHDVGLAERLGGQRGTHDHVVVGGEQQGDVGMGLQQVHAGGVAALDVPGAGHRGNDLETVMAFDAVEEAADALGRVIAGLAFDHADLFGAVADLGDQIVGKSVGAVALGIADHGVDWGREFGDVGIDDDNGDALFDGTGDQRRGRGLVMGPTG